MNRLIRVNDPEIHRWTPADAVKRILEGRFRRRGRRPGTASMARETARRSPLGSRTKVGMVVDGRIVDRARPPAEREQYEKILMCIVGEGVRSELSTERFERVGPHGSTYGQSGRLARRVRRNNAPGPLPEACAIPCRWCRGRDLNPHELPHAILSRARLPFRHPGALFQASILPWCSPNR